MGELIYAVAKADGVIQDEEIEVLNFILKSHPWASSIQWSFDYERQKETPVEEIYNKVISNCHSYGPSPEYAEFIDVMNKVAAASEGVDEHEKKIIKSFSRDLTERFKRDIERLM